MTTLVTEETELCKELELDNTACLIRRPGAGAASSTLPGQPRIGLNSSELVEYLRKEHLVPDLDLLASKLWLVSTPRSSHVSPLHHQAARGRTIIVAEHPQLHLVWSYDRIFIKPIPRYLLSHAFWKYLERDTQLHQAAVGFLRTYSYLIRYETDFKLAVSSEMNLLPTTEGTDPITFERFAKFIAPFAQAQNHSVTPRYHYGELRLTRLNICARIFLRKLTFHHIDAQWGAYLGRLLTPIFSAFAIVSIILNAMQVELSVQGSPQVDASWLSFSNISRWFSIVTLVLVAGTVFVFGVLVFFMLVHDIWFARQVLHREKVRQAAAVEDYKSGVV